MKIKSEKERSKLNDGYITFQRDTKKRAWERERKGDRGVKEAKKRNRSTLMRTQSGL